MSLYDSSSRGQWSVKILSVNFTCINYNSLTVLPVGVAPYLECYTLFHAWSGWVGRIAVFFCRLDYTVKSERFFYTMKNPSLAKLVLSKWLDFSLRSLGTRPISSHLDLALDLSITQIIDLEHEAFAPILSQCYGSLIIKNEQYMFKS